MFALVTAAVHMPAATPGTDGEKVSVHPGSLQLAPFQTGGLVSV